MSIRALVATTCFVALLTSSAAAQQIGGGVKGGLSLGDVPNITKDIYGGGSTSLRTGFAAGGFLAIRFSGGFSIQPEVLYTQKGVKITWSDVSGSGDIKYKADYLDVPILARLTLGKGVRGYLFAGPSLDFRLNAKVGTSFLGESDDQDVSEDVESFEFAIVFGGGVEFGPLLLEARWSEGLTDVVKESPGESSADVTTRTYLFLVGFRF